MKTAKCEVTNTEKTGHDGFARASQSVMRSLGSITGVSYGFVRNTGRFIQTGSKKLARLSKTATQSGPNTAAETEPLSKPVEKPVSTKNTRTEAMSQTSALEPDAEAAAVRGRAMKALVTALESDLAAVRRELAEVRRQAKDTKSELTSQLKALQAKKDCLNSEPKEAPNETGPDQPDSFSLEGPANGVKSLEAAISEPVTVPKSKPPGAGRKRKKPSRPGKNAKAKSSSDVSAVPIPIETILPDGGQNKAVVVAVEEKVVSSMKSTAEADEKMDVRIEDEEIQPLPAETEATKPVDVTLVDVEAADWPDASEKVIFTKALSDIAGKGAAVRKDGVKVIAGIRHELSVRVLTARLAQESSAQVRQECIKALMTLQMPEGLAAVEIALTDGAAPVRLAAVWALYRLAGAESAPALINVLSDEDEEVRRRAATCIGWLGQKELVGELLPLLDDSSASVRRAAVEAMGALRSRQAVSILIEHLNDPAESVRKAALGALKTITGKKMGGAFPKNKKSLQSLTARWQEWWKEQCAKQDAPGKK